jgi:transposase-like protein/IS1 family transposase
LWLIAFLKARPTMTCHFCSANAKKFGTYGPKKIQRYRCQHCGKTFTTEEKLGEMYTSVEEATRVINLLVEGVGINAASRLSGFNKETILKILVKAGENAAKIMDSRLRQLPIPEIQCDEIWGFVRKKERHVKPTDNAALCGDFYTFVAFDRQTKLVISFSVGKRTAPTTQHFMIDVADRISGRPQVSTDSFGAYKHAVRRAFDGDVDHGQIVKVFAKGTSEERRYSPPEVIGTIRTPMTGQPAMDRICTSHVERSNLNMRTFMRRLTRLPWLLEEVGESEARRGSVFCVVQLRSHSRIAEDYSRRGCRNCKRAVDACGIASLARKCARVGASRR